MSDNLNVTPGVGATIAAESIGGILIQRVKLSIGVVDTDNGDVAASNPMPVITTQLPSSLGQQNMAGSSSVVIASDQSAVPISGSVTVSNFPATQPVSAASLPLPSGASTSALQTTGNSSLSTIATNTPALGQALAAASVPVVLTVAQISTLTPLSSIGVNNFPSTQAISAVSLPLPSGASTSALQTTGNTSLATIATNIPAQGQALSAASMPVVLPAAQITALTPPTSVGLNAGSNNVGSITNVTGTVSLPTGAATSVLQSTGNTSLSTIATNIPVQGQALAAASLPVVLTAAQITTLTPPTTVTSNQGTAASLANAWSMKITDTTNGPVAVKASTTAVATTDTSLAVGLSPNSPLPAGTNNLGIVNQNSVTISGSIAGNGNILQLPGGGITSLLPYSGVVIEISGTWSSTLTLVGSNGGSYFTIDVINLGVPNSNAQSTITSNGLYYAPVGSALLELISSSYVSGTVLCYATFRAISPSLIPPATVTVPLPTGASTSANQATEITSLQSIDNPIGSSTGGAAGTDSFLVGGLFNTTVPALTNGEQIGLQVDTRGALQTTLLDGSRATYSAAFVGSYASAANATDVFTIAGSASKTIRVLRMAISGTQTTGGSFFIQVIKRSAVNTGGTSAAVTAVPNDSSDSAATATVLNYTANPSALGAAIGTVRSVKAFVPATNTSPDQPLIEFDFGNLTGKAIVLRGTTQVLAINFNGATLGAGSINCFCEWTEE